MHALSDPCAGQNARSPAAQGPTFYFHYIISADDALATYDLQGATDAAIEAIPLVTVEADTLRHTDGDSTCPICLSDMAIGEKVRVMPCKHVFHSQV